MCPRLSILPKALIKVLIKILIFTQPCYPGKSLAPWAFQAFWGLVEIQDTHHQEGGRGAKTQPLQLTITGATMPLGAMRIYAYMV